MSGSAVRMRQQRILVVSASMGAGHDQSARELARRFRARGARVRIVDFLELLPLGTGRWLRGFYGGALAHAPHLYSAVYRTFMAPVHRSGGRTRLLALLGALGLAPVVRDFRPTAVISTFHAAGQAVGVLRQRGRLPEGTPAVVVITEMVAHGLWLGAGTDLYCAMTEPVAARVRAATDVEAIAPGPLVAPEFLRAGLGYGGTDGTDGAGGARGANGAGGAAPPVTAVVSAGSRGWGDVASTARDLAAGGIRPLVLCGRNTGLRSRIECIPGSTALGWRDDVAEILAGADALVDNAGGSMCMEALAAGVPVVEYRPLPGHGRPVAHELADEGLVATAEDARSLVATVRSLSRVGDAAGAGSGADSGAGWEAGSGATGAESAGNKPAGTESAENKSDRATRIARGRAIFREDPAAAIARWLAGRSAENSGRTE